VFECIIFKNNKLLIVLGRARIVLTPEPELVDLVSQVIEEESSTGEETPPRHEVSSFDEEAIFSRKFLRVINNKKPTNFNSTVR